MNWLLNLVHEGVESLLAIQMVLVFAIALLTSVIVVPLTLKFATARKLFDHPDGETNFDAVLSKKSDLMDFKVKSAEALCGEHMAHTLNLPTSSAKADKLQHMASQGSTIPRRVHKVPTPRLGGIAIVSGFFLSLLIIGIPGPLKGILMASFGMFCIGLWDDIKPLSAKFRLLAQVLLCIFAVYSGNLALQNVTLSPSLVFDLPTLLGFALSVFVMVGAINSTNMIDGLDGLAGGVVLIGVALLSFGLFLSTKSIEFLLFFSIPIMGSLFGFLKYNTHPARIFMGDGGSNWLGFMVGTLILMCANRFSIVPLTEAGTLATSLTGVMGQTDPKSSWYSLSQQPVGGFTFGPNSAALPIPLISVVMCFAVPVFDTAMVLASRFREGQGLMVADNRHFHHSLLRLGFSHSQSVVAVYFTALVFGVIGLLPIAFAEYNLGILPYLGTALGILFLYTVLKLQSGIVTKLMENRKIIGTSGQQAPAVKLALRYWERANRYCIYGILIGIPIFAGAPNKEIGMVAAIACGMLLIISLFRIRDADFLHSLLLATGAAVLLVANNQNSVKIGLFGEQINIQFLYNYAFIFLLASTLLLAVVTFRRNYLIIVPSDFLLVLLPLMLLVVPEPWRNQYRLNIIGMRCLVLFMAIRLLTKRHSQIAYRFRVVCIFALAFVALGGLLQMRVVY